MLLANGAHTELVIDYLQHLTALLPAGRCLSSPLSQESRKLSKQERSKILAFYRIQHAQSKVFNEGEILASLPPVLAGDVMRHLYLGTLCSIPLFRGLSFEASC